MCFVCSLLSLLPCPGGGGLKGKQPEGFLQFFFLPMFLRSCRKLETAIAFLAALSSSVPVCCCRVAVHGCGGTRKAHCARWFTKYNRDGSCPKEFII